MALSLKSFSLITLPKLCPSLPLLVLSHQPLHPLPVLPHHFFQLFLVSFKQLLHQLFFIFLLLLLHPLQLFPLSPPKLLQLLLPHPPPLTQLLL